MRQPTSLVACIFTRRLAVLLLLGFASGLPYRLTGDTLQAWMTQTGRTLASISLFTLVGLPYTLKFLWAPLFDRYMPPILGRRRGWIVISQLGCTAAIVALALTGPGGALGPCAAAAFILAFFSASQDIVLDAHRRDTLPDEELAFGSSLFVTGYRVGMLAAGPAALLLSNRLPWTAVYLVMAVLMAFGIAAVWLAPEPETDPPASITDAILLPLHEFFARLGVRQALLVLLFIIFYKLGDTMAATMLTPFILQMGYTINDLALAAETLGLFATVAGGIVGGLVVLRLGINSSLWLFGLFQMVTTAGFIFIDPPPHSVAWLSIIVIFEKSATGMSSVAFVAFLMRLTNRTFSANQYALLTSMMGVAPKIFSAQTGFLAEAVGWRLFFLLCTVAALPGLILLHRLTVQGGAAPAQAGRERGPG